MASRAQLVVPAELASLPLVQALAAELAAELPFETAARHALRLAVEEALTQILGHSFTEGETGDLEVCFEVLPRGLRVLFKDRGLPFDFAAVPEYAPGADLLEDAAAAGLSKFLLKGSVDSVRFSNLGRGGSELELLKLFSTREISQYEPAPAAPAPPSEETVAEVRRFLPEDAIAISRLIHLSYGNSYVYEDMYYPERIVALHEEGMLQSIVALSDRGRLVGHVALALPWRGAGIVEWGIAVVDPTLRGQGLMKRLMTLIEHEVRRHAYTGIFAHAVTNHDFTQKLCVSYRYSETALLLGYAPATLVFRKITDAPTQREATFVAYRLCTHLEAPRLHLPPAHRDLILRLYSGIGVNAEAAPPAREPRLAERTVFRTTVAGALNTASIMVDELGPDHAVALRRELRRLCLERVDMIYAYLDLALPALPAACEALEAAGCFFAGIFPGHPYPHTLVLQYANNVPIDFARVKAASPLAQELHAYVGRAQARAMS